MTSMEDEVVAGFLKKATVPDLTLDEQKELQKVAISIKNYWKNKDSFIENLHKDLTPIFGKKLNYNKLISVLLYFRENLSLIKPQEAYEMFHSIGLTQQNAPYKKEKEAGDLTALQELLINHSDFGLETNLALFKLKAA